MEIEDTNKCPVCDATIKSYDNSLHVWQIEYECGCTIWGAIDTETHSDSIEFNKECPNKS